MASATPLTLVLPAAAGGAVAADSAAGAGAGLAGAGVGDAIDSAGTRGTASRPPVILGMASSDAAGMSTWGGDWWRRDCGAGTGE